MLKFPQIAVKEVCKLMGAKVLKIICVEFENLNHFKQGNFKVDFIATDRVLKNSELYNVSGNIFSQSTIGFIGLNATGKTTVLRLLNIALSVIIDNKDLNSLNMNEMIVSGTKMIVTFFYNGVYYQLESVIEYKVNSDGRRKFFYGEEILRKKYPNRVKFRKNISDFSDEVCSEITTRSKLSEDSLIQYLDDGKSIVSPLIRDNESFLSDNLFSSYANIATPLGKVPSEILEVFDESIETLIIEEQPTKDNQSGWKLKFKNTPIGYSNPNALALNLIISTGTISGQELIQKAILALKSGGYLIVDELEMHLNKEIVRTILNIFKSTLTNPYGACLIFSIHYAELLDVESLNRKDNIYITRKSNHLLSVSKFSDEISRNDYKKSEIFLSNALGGTAPKNKAIQRLRDYICKLL